MRRHPEKTRQRALQLLADGLDPSDVGAKLGLSPGTVAAWKHRYPLPAPTVAPPSAPPASPSGVGGGGSPPSPPTARSSKTTPRPVYLDELMRTLADLANRAADDGNWTGARALLSEHSAAHKELVELERMEGATIDLTRDPRTVARRVEAAAVLLRQLAVDLDTPEGTP